MITIAIIGILATLAPPAFAQSMRDRRVTTPVNELVAAMNFARSEAIKRGAPVSMCPTSNPNQANPNCDTADDFSNGWLVFVDTQGPGRNGAIDPNDPLLRVHGPGKAASGQRTTPGSGLRSTARASRPGATISHSTPRAARVTKSARSR